MGLIDNRAWVYDIETIRSVFTLSAINISTNEVVKFVLHKDRWDLTSLIQWLYSCKYMIGFNNINFDYPVIHRLLLVWANKEIKQEEYSSVILDLYDEAQRIIEEQSKDFFHKIVAIKTKEIIIPQLDLFKIWHYNNKARRTSLKALEISMNYPNVMEMPILHDRDNITVDEIEGILEYNLNDVLATFEFFKKTMAKISLRKSIKKQFDIPCYNFSDTKIGEELILKLYSTKTNQNPWDVKKMRSERSKITLKDIILPYINFQSKEFKELLDYFQNKVITGTKGSIEKSVIYQGFKYDYGTGGIHGCVKPGIYKADDEYVIMDADVGSLYPNLAITNNFYPEHLGPVFNEVYKSIIDMRMEAKRNGNSVLSDGFKLAANSVYG